MRTLIRFVSRAKGGALETSERLYDGEALTLGRATDQVLQFKDGRVAFQHARIFRRGPRTLLACRAPATIIVNDALVREVELSVGDVLRLGANVLTLVTAPAGVDLALTFELDAAASEADLATVRAPLLLSGGALGKRGWSWLLFLTLLGAFLVLPVLVLPGKTARDALRASGLPSDHAWSPGALHTMHQTIAGRCEVCHQQAFVRVRNEACLACHQTDLHRHVDADRPGAGTLETTRCFACHSGHEPAPLIRGDAGGCIDCHAGAAGVGAASRIGAVSDFGNAHPEFRVSLLRTDANGGVAPPERLRLDTPALREHSHLKFPHATHLDPRGVKTLDSRRVLGCADCHVPEPGGRRMLPIRMETHCQGCHRLDFDPAYPDRQLPHRDVAVVMNALLEYYSARYLEGWPDPNARSLAGRFAATPGPALAPAERARRLGLARARTQVIARDLFERRACNVCHEVQPTPGAPTPWRVTSVRLTQNWLPAAHFDHAQHTTTLTPCSACHAAAHSTQSADVLMPRIATCRQCHAGTGGATPPAGKVATGCPACHSFHDQRRAPWVLAARPAGPRR